MAAPDLYVVNLASCLGNAPLHLLYEVTSNRHFAVKHTLPSFLHSCP